MAIGFVGMLVSCPMERKRILRGLLLSALMISVLLCVACGGIPSASNHAQTSVGVAPGAYTIMVNATSAATQTSTAATVTIR